MIWRHGIRSGSKRWGSCGRTGPIEQMCFRFSQILRNDTEGKRSTEKIDYIEDERTRWADRVRSMSTLRRVAKPTNWKLLPP